MVCPARVWRSRTKGGGGEDWRDILYEGGVIGMLEEIQIAHISFTNIIVINL